MSQIRFNRRAARRGAGRCYLERLESRRLLSANVTASVANGELYLQGDYLSDSVVIDQAGLTSTQLRVSSGDGLTTINGKTSPSVFSGVSSVVVNTGAGNDTVTIKNATISAGVQFSDPSGNQVLTLNNDTIAGNFSVTTDGGVNNILIEGGTTITGNVTVNAGAVFNSQGYCGSWSYANTEEIFTLTGNSAIDNNLIITNAGGNTVTSIQAGSLVGGNVTVTNTGSSDGQSSCYDYCGQCGTTTSSGDTFTLGNSTVDGNVSLTNNSADNQTDLEDSIILGSLTLANSGNFSSACNTYCDTSVDATDVFTLDGSSVGGNVALSNVSNNVTTTINASSLLGSVTVTNTGGSSCQSSDSSCQSSDCYGQCGGTYSQCSYSYGGCGGSHGQCGYSYSQCGNSYSQCGSSFGQCSDCCGSCTTGNSTSPTPTGDVFTLTASTVLGSVALNNGSSYADTSIGSSVVLGNLTVGNTVSSASQSSGGCSKFTACGSSCGKCSFSCGQSCHSSTSSANSDDIFTMTASSVSGNLTIANPSGTSSITINGSAVIVNTAIVNGTGIATMNVIGNSTFVGNVNVTAGNGTVTVDFTTGSTVIGNATFNVPAGATLTITPSQVGGTLTT